jgi:hypothetical protein
MLSFELIYIFFLSSGLIDKIVDFIKFLFCLSLNLIIKNTNFSSIDDNKHAKEIVSYIIKTHTFIEKYTTIDSELQPDGYFFSFKNKYLGYIEHKVSQGEFMVNREFKVSFYGKIPFKITNKVLSVNNNLDNNIQELVNNNFTIHLSRGYSNPSFYEFKIECNDIPYSFQQEIIENILDFYNKSKRKVCRSLICGSTNIGKSTIGRILASQLKGHLCFDIDLLAPGNTMGRLYDDVEPNENNVLIIQIDEFDVLIDNIHNKKCETKKVEWLRNNIYDKATYNRFMSEYIVYFPNIIWLFTSNKPLSYFNNLDESYINSNRIDITKEVF